MPRTKEEIKEYKRQYHIKNRERRIKQMKEYRNNNKEKLKQSDKERYKTEKGKKSNRISQWKRQGILCFNYNLLYDIFLSTKNCEFCNCELTEDHSATSRCLDHDHTITDKFNVRGVLCRKCNSSDVLREEPAT